MRFFEIAQPVFAHEASDELGRVAARRRELRVRAAVGHAGDRPAVADDVAQRFDGVRHRVDVERGLEVVARRDVEERVDVVLAEDVTDVGDRVVLEALRVRSVRANDHDAIQWRGARERQARLEGLATAGVADLCQALFDGADQHLAPRIGIVEQVEVFEREREAEVGRRRLPVDAQALQTALLEPGDGVAMRIGRAIDRPQHVEDHRPAADRGHLFESASIGIAIARRDRHLDEALAPARQHASQHSARLVVHHVGRHRRAVVVTLQRHRAGRHEALRRPSARAGVHRLVEQPRHLVVLGVGRQRAGLRPLEAHHPDQQRRQRNVRQQVDRLRRALEAVEELGEGHPIPRHAGLHRIERDRLVARHRQHRALAQLGCTGAKPKPQLPITTDVTPCQPESEQYGSQKTCAS